MLEQPPLGTLLSQALVAFTIEFDNEFERRVPHRTSVGPASGVRGAPWLVSMVMWSNFLYHLDAGGAPRGDVDDLVRMTNLGGLVRWRWVTVTDERPKSPRRQHIVRPTEAALRAKEVWGPLGAEIEQRWRERFDIGRLATALRALTSQLTMALPRYLPVVNYADGMRTTIPDVRRDYTVDLSVLLSHALIAYTLEYEAESDLSLPIIANVLRVLDGSGVVVRELPARAGVSRESVKVALGFLERHGFVELRPVGRDKSALLTSKGRQAQEWHHELSGQIEERWRQRFGAATVAELRAALEQLTGELLWQGLTPYPDGWRAAIRRPTTLPHHPMVLHRGGYPDGS